jgi:hypothetical protein
MLPSLPQRNARRHETNRSFLLVQKGYQDGVNHNAGYAQRRAVPAWVSIAEKWVVFIKDTPIWAQRIYSRAQRF